MPGKSHRRAPWGKILGKPIERLVGHESLALDEQFEKMRRLKQHYGIEGETGWRPWYQLALAIASELDDGLKIIDPPPTPTGRTAPRWRGAEGLQILAEIKALRGGGSITTHALLAELKELAHHRYSDMTLDELEKNYYEAKRFHNTTKHNPKKYSTS